MALARGSLLPPPQAQLVGIPYPSSSSEGPFPQGFSLCPGPRSSGQPHTDLIHSLRSSSWEQSLTPCTSHPACLLGRRPPSPGPGEEISAQTGLFRGEITACDGIRVNSASCKLGI